MYRWWVFVHILAVFGFLAAHGVSMSVLFRLRSERNPAKVVELLELSGSSIRAFYWSMAVLVASGVVVATLGGWWSQAWIWAAILVLIASSAAMIAMARQYYRRVGLVARALAGGSTAVGSEQFEGMLRSRRSTGIAVVGVVALAFILYLMMFKPTFGIGGGVPTATGPSPTGAVVQVSATNLAFDTATLTVPADRPFTIAFANLEAVPHNVSIWRDSTLSEPLFVGEVFSGPRTENYAVEPLPAGTYYFQCDVHPPMNGEVVAR
jgi:plastocyanin